MMRGVARPLVITAAAFSSLGFDVSAQASTVTVGSPIPAATVFGLSLCNASPGCAFTQLSLPEPVALVQAPFEGVIVRWCIKGANTVSGYTLRTLRNTGGLDFTDQSSAPVTPSGEGLEVFSANLPIHAGDYIGLVVPENGTIRSNFAGGTYGFLGSALTETGSATATASCRTSRGRSRRPPRSARRERTARSARSRS
jgi:hypothetical protein